MRPRADASRLVAHLRRWSRARLPRRIGRRSSPLERPLARREPPLPDDAARLDQLASQQHVERADAALAAASPDAALEALAAALLTDPGWHGAVHGLARWLEADGQAEPAAAAYRGLIRPQVLERLIAPARERRLVPALTDADVRPTIVHAAERIAMPALPDAVSDARPELGAAHVDAEPAVVYRLPEGRVWHDAANTFVADASGRCVIALDWRNAELARRVAERHSPARHDGRLVLLGAPGADNYYHWTLDVLPKLALLAEAGVSIGPDDRLLLPPPRRSFQCASLARLGIAEEQILYSDESTPYWSAAELVVPMVRNRMGLGMGRWVPRALQRMLAAETVGADALSALIERAAARPRPPGAVDGDGRCRLFVSRDAASSQGRSIIDETRLHALADEYRLVVVHPERLSPPEQAVLFHAASLIVAPHGAGLANIAFCRPGSRVIECVGEHYELCYRAISAVLGLHYEVVCREDTALDGTTGSMPLERARSIAARRTADIAIDVEALRRALAKDAATDR